MFNVVLVEPEIPPNTGNVIRLCANTGCHLHLVEPLGFNFDDKHMRRAGLDYHEYASLRRHASWKNLLSNCKPNLQRMFALTTSGTQSPFNVSFQVGDWLIFGSETKGLKPDVRASFPIEQRLRLPMVGGQRSMNLSNAVAVTVFEAWRQTQFAMGLPKTP